MTLKITDNQYSRLS